MREKYKELFSKHKYVLFTVLCIFIAAVVLVPKQQYSLFGSPTLEIEMPQKLSVSDYEPFMLDVSISDLGGTIYPAASMSISFDSSRLEFLGVTEGNVFVHDSENAASNFCRLPEWSCNIQQSNDTGKINIMYLDITGGRHAFSKELLAEKDNVVIRLNFRLRGSVRTGDVIDLVVEDAVFAASDETLSLSSASGTLKTNNSRIVIGE